MVNKRLFNLGILIFVIILAVIMMNYSDGVVEENYVDEMVFLGYCPTMKETAYLLSEGKGYELIEFNSAGEVLFSLRSGQIDKALIGRKAETVEVNSEIIETVLKSGHTLVSNKKDFVEYYNLDKIEIHTTASRKIVSELIIDDSNVFYYENKEEVLNKIREGEVALISWEDWNDEFGLIVVMNGANKVKGFRGEFLYERV